LKPLHFAKQFTSTFEQGLKKNKSKKGFEVGEKKVNFKEAEIKVVPEVKQEESKERESSR
jgi:hypothetical protein